jgi:hypothetical protein
MSTNLKGLFLKPKMNSSKNYESNCVHHINNITNNLYTEAVTLFLIKLIEFKALLINQRININVSVCLHKVSLDYLDRYNW